MTKTLSQVPYSSLNSKKIKNKMGCNLSRAHNGIKIYLLSYMVTIFLFIYFLLWNISFCTFPLEWLRDGKNNLYRLIRNYHDSIFSCTRPCDSFNTFCSVSIPCFPLKHGQYTAVCTTKNEESGRNHNKSSCLILEIQMKNAIRKSHTLR